MIFNVYRVGSQFPIAAMFVIHGDKLTIIAFHNNKSSPMKILMADVFVWYGATGNIAGTHTCLPRQVNELKISP